MSKHNPKYWAYDEPVPGYTKRGLPVTCNQTVIMEESDIIYMMRSVYHDKLTSKALLDEFVTVHFARRVCSICELSV